MNKDLTHELGHAVVAALINETPRFIDMRGTGGLYTTYYIPVRNITKTIYIQSGGIAIETLLFEQPRVGLCKPDYDHVSRLMRLTETDWALLIHKHNLIVWNIMKTLKSVMPIIKTFEQMHRYDETISYKQLKPFTDRLRRYPNAIPLDYGCEDTGPNNSPSTEVCKKQTRARER